ncbi:hypothetical protein SDJN02_07198, partial [Cucurbita argyrosperma subsp. argyrosperma]
MAHVVAIPNDIVSINLLLETAPPPKCAPNYHPHLLKYKPESEQIQNLKSRAIPTESDSTEQFCVELS